MRAILLAALVTLAGASLVFAEGPAAPQPKATSTNAPPADTLGFIETRDRSIEIKAGDTGSYTVRTKDGKVLAERISASQLQAQFPQLHQILQYGYARNTDARLDLNPSARHTMRMLNSGGTTPVVRDASWNTDASIQLTVGSEVHESTTASQPPSR
jgi:hypothetical protein